MTHHEADAGLPLWREVFTPFDWWLLHTTPTWLGLGVPRGNGEPVITVPGFLGTDAYLLELQWWLGRVGYTAFSSDIGRNADCPNVLTGRLAATVRRAHETTGRRVHLIGHSLGGVLARSVAAQLPASVASVTTLGSPFRGIRSHPVVFQTSELVRTVVLGRPSRQFLPRGCYTGRCTCEFVEALDAFPANVRELAIYTKSDGIVDWQLCRTGDPAKDHEVLGTHIGLAFNPFVYRRLGDFLAGDTRARD
jgi:triacylglycerol esterase/lipase EstA (alpha/beta hydrolase family)